MVSEFRVSVIIPFYNAREYVTQAVESCLEQAQTAEVILVDDNSPDGGLAVCKSLAQKYNQVKLLRHLDGENHGAAATRNLGISNSHYPYIAFLDADDYYLPNRFLKTAEVFANNIDAEGVYEAIGATFQDNNAKDMWNRLPLLELTTINKIVSPDILFEKIIFGNIGTFSFNGLTAKKSLINRTGCFSEKLQFFEDTDLMIKLSASGTLYPGSIDKPIAIRRVHQGNRITHHLDNKRESYASHIALWQSLKDWGKTNISYERQLLVILRYVDRLRKVDYFTNLTWKEFIHARMIMARLACEFPEIFLKSYYWRRFLPSKQIFLPK